MHTIEIPEANYKREIPASLEEMNQEQFLFYVERVLDFEAGRISEDTFKTRLILYLADIKITRKFSKMDAEHKEIVASNIQRLTELLEGYFQTVDHEGKQVRTFNVSFTKNLVPSIRISGAEWIGPQSGFVDVCFLEFIHAYGHFIEFLKTRQEGSLDRLIATLYRPEIPDFERRKIHEDFDGQRRIRFNQYTLDQRATMVAGLPYAVKYGIFLFFMGCEEFLRSGKVEIEGNTVDLGILYDSSRKKAEEEGVKSDGIGWLGVLFSIAESGVFGNIEQTANQNIYDILFRIYQQIREYQEFKAKIKRNDKNQGS